MKKIKVSVSEFYLLYAIARHHKLGENIIKYFKTKTISKAAKLGRKYYPEMIYGVEDDEVEILSMLFLSVMARYNKS